MKVIKTRLGVKGNAKITLYGKEIVISKDSFDDSGKAKVTAFGEDYLVEIERPTKKQRTSAKVKAAIEKENRDISCIS